MPNIATVLKDEIARLARREVKAATEALKKSSSRHRSEMAALKREIAALQKQIGHLVKGASRKPAEMAKDDTTPAGLRFRADGLRKHRERLGLSAAAAGKLLGVSALTIYNWEGGKTRPRQAQLVKIAGFRKLSKREAEAILEALRAS